MNTQPRFAFFGSTGGSVAACLALALKDGYSCSALVRNEEKLKKVLSDRGVDSETQSKHLHIVVGDIKDIDAVSKTLKPEGSASVVDVVISGVGSVMLFTNPLRPTLQDTTICEDATNTIFEALRLLGGRPHLVAITSVGISDKGRDMPLALLPLRYWLLPVALADKKKTERLIEADFAKSEVERAIRGYTIVRPTILTDSKSCGLDRIRVGGDENPAIGYSISRDDVGLWIFENTIKKAQELEGGNIVSMTY
ncbi:hypothetical protein HDK90DRAFT_122678 [Phyllosticta capitalensis]|uniref:NAD(P)-binding domain-containing protein n=1 Tax=Phyllosticta capitalensis TaxID=121624 RepID=A0ABR1YXI8_9PEZI